MARQTQFTDEAIIAWAEEHDRTPASAIGTSLRRKLDTHLRDRGNSTYSDRWAGKWMNGHTDGLVD